LKLSMSKPGASASGSESRGLITRLMAGAVPAALSTAVLAFLPLIGRAFLTSEEYAYWALVATVGTVGLVFDFGAPALATRLTGMKSMGPRQTVSVALMSAAGSIVVGFLAAAVWPFYAQVSSLDARPEMIVLFIAVGFGSALRSVLTVYCAIALGRSQFLLRGVTLSVQALLQTAATAGLLAAGLSLWTFPVAQFVATIPVLIYVAIRLPFDMNTHLVPPVWPEVRRFVKSRGLASVMGLSFTQLDRWFVGLVASPVFVANYDLAARLASIPKMAVLTLGLSYVLESTRQKHNLVSVLQALRRLSLINFVILIVGYAGCVALILVLGGVFSVSVDMSFVIVFSALAIAGFANSMTAPGVMLLTGLGRPDFELRYLVPAFILAALVVSLGVWQGNEWVVTGGLTGGLAFGSILFLFRQKSYFRQSIGGAS